MTQRILIIKLGALGDAVTASTMIPVLKNKYADSHITWLCGNEILPLVQTFSGIDEIVSLDNKLLAGSLFDKLRFVTGVWRKFAGKKFDLILTAHRDKRYSFIPMGIRGINKRIMNGRFDIIPGRYHGNEYARFALKEDTNFKKDYPFASPKDILTGNSAGTIFLLPGGAKNIMSTSDLRRWPLEYYRDLAEVLTAEGHNVALIGGADDAWVTEGFQGTGVVSYIGKTSISEVLSMLKDCKCLIAHDSGPVYMAAYLGRPVISLFGPLMPCTRLSEDDLKYSISSGMPCSPCYDGRYYASECTDNKCMKSITTAAVLEKMRELGII